ncbi:MAG: ATP-binding protein [Candidatus Omnitrophota bacterium]
MKLYPLLSLIAGLVCFSFASIVIFKGKENKKNRSFFLASALTGIWTLFPFLTSLPKNNSSVLVIARLLYFFAAFVPTAWYYFMVNLLEIEKNQRKTIFFIFISVIFASLSFTPLLVKGVARFAPNFYPQAGAFYFLFIIFFLIIFSEIILRLYLVFKNATGYRKSQILYVCVAYTAGALSGALHFLSAYTGKEPISHDIFIILYPIIITYTITKYRLLDIEVLITRTGIFVSVYTLVLGLPFLFAYLFKNSLINLLGADWWMGPLVLMAFLATAGPFMYIYLQKRTEAILLREQRRYQEALKQAAVGMTRIHNLNKLLNFLVDNITKNVRISHSAIYLRDSTTGDFTLKDGRNLKKNQPVFLNKSNLLVDCLQKQKDPLLYEEVKRKSEETPDSVFSELEKQMRSLNASVVVACSLDDKLLGLLILGNKYSGKSYTTDDLDIFLLLASGAALAIENALLYENIEAQVQLRTQELVEVQKQLVHAEKLATVGTLAGGVAHEINNPLTAILTNVQMLLSGDELDKESLEMIEEATKRCKTIVQKLMAFSKKPMESTMMYRINLLEIIQRTVDFLKYQLEQDNISLEVTAGKESYPVMANHDELGQVVTNIVLNARDAIKQIKKSGTVFITLLEEENWIKICIKDEGVGIPPEILNRIFDPFFTTKEVGKGLGLGLSICQSIIEKHKGKIIVESELNKGSMFVLQLPKLKDE